MKNYILTAKCLLALMPIEYRRGYKCKKDATRAKHREIAEMKKIHPYYRAYKFKVIKVQYEA